MQANATLQHDKQQTAMLGMMIALGSWTMLFGTFLFGYVVLRLQATHWYSFGLKDTTFLLATANTVVILLSSILYGLAQRSVKHDAGESVGKFLWGALGCGVLFMAIQIALWQGLMSEGIKVSTSIAGGAIFALTGLHVIHVLGGLGAILWLALRSRRVMVSSDNKMPLVLVGWFWHFLTIIWCVFYTAIFVIH